MMIDVQRVERYIAFTEVQAILHEENAPKSSTVREFGMTMIRKRVQRGGIGS
jgi:hypothetical protein